jgi:mRNA interferase MazF
MKRGDIYYAALDPTVGSEIKKNRPVLLVSNNANNKAASTVTVIPITSNISQIYPFEVYLETQDSQLLKPSKAQCHQIRTISKLRISGNRIGSIKATTMQKIESAIKLHLDLA